MATTTRCDRCSKESKNENDFCAIISRKAHFGPQMKEHDLCPICLAVIQQVISDECANFKNRLKASTT